MGEQLPKARETPDNSAMDTSLLFILAAIALFVLRMRDQRRRIALLGSHLRNYQIEKLMETLSAGYERALGESDTGRQDQIFALMQPHEAALAGQFRRFAAEMAGVDAQDARVSTFPLAIPQADRLFPFATFDLRNAFEIHAAGLERAAEIDPDRPLRERAFVLSAEMYLMQHTCHWYCKSRAVASARLLARHRTRYEQVLDAVSPETRRAYRELTGV